MRADSVQFCEALAKVCATPPRRVDPATLDLGFFQAAIAQDVVPLVVSRLRDAQDLLPETAEGLGLVREMEVSQVAQRLEDLEDVLQMLVQSEVSAIVLEGLVLAQALFEDPAARACHDLDLLVRRADLPQAMAVLSSLGYGSDPLLGARTLQITERYNGQHSLFHPTRTPLKLHWAMAPSTLAFSLDVGEAWARGLTVRVGSVEARVLDPIDTMLWLSVHGTKNHWSRLKGVADIAALLHCHADINWDTARARATRQGCRRCVDIAVLLAGDLLGSALPFTIDDPIAHRIASATAARVRTGKPAPPAPYVLLWVYWDSRERLRDRLSYVARTALTPRAPHYARLVLPRWLDWLHYVIKIPWDYLFTPLLQAKHAVIQAPRRHEFTSSGRTVTAVSENSSNPFDFFDAIYCINLYEATDRWQSVSIRFKRAGIMDRVQRFPAIRTPENHHIGCALSHRAIVDRARHLGLNNVLVFEDDVILTDNVLPLLSMAIRELEGRSWNLFYLGGCRWSIRFPLVDGCAHLQRAGHLTSSHAVAYSKSVYDRILAEVPSEMPPFMDWLEKQKGIDQYFAFSISEGKYIINPVVATQPVLVPFETNESREQISDYLLPAQSCSQALASIVHCWRNAFRRFYRLAIGTRSLGADAAARHKL